MSTTAISFRPPQDLSTAARAKAKRMGIHLSAILTTALKNFVQKKEAPTYHYSKKDLARFEKIIADTEKGIGIAAITHGRAETRAYLESLK